MVYVGTVTATYGVTVGGVYVFAGVFPGTVTGAGDGVVVTGWVVEVDTGVVVTGVDTGVVDTGIGVVVPV